MENLSLAQRDQLPDALRVLLAEYPRLHWENDPGFDGLIRFWLDRHLMFRRILGELQSGTRALLNRNTSPDRYAAMVARYGSMFVKGLHEHHTIEDTYYFPKLAAKDARIEKGFTLLDQDHHDIDAFLASFVSAADTVIQTSRDRDTLQTAAGSFQTELVTLKKLLNRHLTDEEDLIVPVILKYGSADLG